MHLSEHLFTLTVMVPILYSHCKRIVKCDTNVQATVLERELDRKSYKNDDDTFNSNVFPKSCYQCGKSGMRKNGYCILYDQSMKKYLAYCDFSSEPGYAWTLAMSLARDVILYDFSKWLKRKAISENCPLNEDTPNWYAFRFNNQRMRAMRLGSTHFRFTCSQHGPFVKLKSYKDYVRVSLAQLDPFNLDDANGKCAAAEFVSIRGNPCSNCTVWFAQMRGIRVLHIDSKLSEQLCSYPGVSKTAVKYEDNFGFYDSFNQKFTCTAHSTSTSQLWFGRALSPSRPLT